MSNYIAATTTADTVNSVLTFNTEGYYVVGDEKWQDITFTAAIIYNGGSVGIAPRIYDTNMYMSLLIHNESIDDSDTEKQGFANLSAQVTYETINLAQARVVPLVVGQTYTFKTEIRGTNYRISLDDTVIFNIEYPGMPRGKVGVYSTVENVCKSIEVESAFADGWNTNVSTIPGAIVDVQELPNEDKHLYLLNPTTSELFGDQTISVVGNKPHTLSFNANGSGIAKLIEMNGAAPKTYNYIINTLDWFKESFTETISADCTSVVLRFSAINESLKINSVQLEEKSFSTGYIHNDNLTEAKIRENSIITYPSKDNIRGDRGSLVMWFKPSMTYSATSTLNPVLFEYGTVRPLRLEYESGKLLFTHGNSSVSYATTLTKDVWHNVVLTWQPTLLKLYLNNELTLLEESHEGPDHSLLINIGHSADPAKDLFFGAIDETMVLSLILEDDDVDLLSTTTVPISNSNAMMMRATFNYAIGNFNKSTIEATLAPDYGSPVLVEKADGKPMRKVSFFDYYTGEYRTFNEEVVQYDKTYDYLTISYYDKDVDEESFKLSVQDRDGVSYGTPYSLVGRKLYLTLTPEEKDKLDGEYLYVKYQLEDSYTVDFNIGVPDSFRVNLGKHDGQKVKVIYEGNNFTNEKLATQVELNPLLSPNHKGFLYITKNDEKVTTFRVRATPEDLPANGGSEALIVVEPLDSYGNYISHCLLDVSCELGKVVPTYDAESIKLRDRAGRFLYRYSSPIMRLDDVGAFEVRDNINIIDRETGLGVQVPITLTTLYERDHEIVAGDTIERIAEKYGSTIQDIAYTESMLNKIRTRYGSSVVKAANTDDKVIANGRRYIEESVGQVIEIPINYSATQLRKKVVAIEHDKMIAYLTNLITDYMNKPISALPVGLGNILDFNGDGKIGIEELTWLRNNRLTMIIQVMYERVLTWFNEN